MKCMRWILPLYFVGFLLIGGCNVDVNAVREKIDEQKQTVRTLADAATALQQLAEKTNDPQYIAAAAAAQKALSFAQDKIPEMECELAKLKNGAPWWNVAIAVAWPFVTPLLKLIPGPGGMIATAIGELAYRMNATRAKKDEDDEAHFLLAKQKTGKINAST